MSSAAPAVSPGVPPAVPLPADFLEMMGRGVSVIVSSSDMTGRPSIMRAVGSEVSGNGQSITVFVSRRQSRQLILDITATRRIAVVFSRPSTHRTVQLKSSGATIRSAAPSDQPALARYLASMEHEIGLVGYGPHMTRAMLAHQLDDLVAISFEPAAAFDQTPGPKAGAALGAAEPRP